MMKPSRLFWKLFLAFWLATSLTFFVGIGIITLSHKPPEIRIWRQSLRARNSCCAITVSKLASSC